MTNSAGRLKRAIDRVRNEPGLGRNVLALFSVVLLGTLCGGYILSQQRFNPPWEDVTYVYATMTEAPGVAPGRGQEVRISGVSVGDIRGTKVDARGRARVLMAIEQDEYARPIYNNATVVLRPKSPLNEMYIEMDPGGPPGRPLPEYGVLPEANTRSPVQVDQALSHLDDNTLAALQGILSASDVALARAPQGLPAGLRATGSVLRELRPVVQQLDIRRQRLSKLVTSVSVLSRALGHDDHRLGRLAESLQTTLAAVSQNSGTLRSSLSQMPGFVRRLRGSTTEVRGLSEQLDPALGELHAATRSLPGSLSRLHDTVGSLDRTLDDARPVVAKLRPVADDLRPFVRDLNPSLRDLGPITRQLDPMTAGLVRYLPDLRAFVYQTNSVTSLQDANGGILRGMLQFGSSTVPVNGTDDVSPTQR